MDEPMKDYPDKMTPEQARTFRDAVLNIVSQIPRGPAIRGWLGEPCAIPQVPSCCLVIVW